MKNKRLNNPWTIGIGSSLTAVIILRLIDSIAHTQILLSIWSSVKWIVSTVIIFFSTKYQVTLIFLVLLPLLVIGLFVFIIWIIIKVQEWGKNHSLKFSFLDYTEDKFGEVLYRWDYFKDFSDKYQLENIQPYCPKCRCAIVEMGCPICKTNFRYRIKDRAELVALISHQIELKCNDEKSNP